jgi:hypothetical protein
MESSNTINFERRKEEKIAQRAIHVGTQPPVGGVTDETWFMLQVKNLIEEPKYLYNVKGRQASNKPPLFAVI